MWKSLVLIVISFAISAGLFEGGYYFYAKWSQHPLREEKRKLFFKASKPVFQNYKDILLYGPDNEVRVVAVYFNDQNTYKEIDYSIRTNNFGLVQDEPLKVGKKSIVLLGDSYTDGFGAEPWFRHFSKHFISDISKDFQPINGGILGAGFQQFWKLENYLLDKKINLQKVVVVFISDDIRRIVFNLEPKLLHCVNGTKPCDGNEGWISFKNDREITTIVEKLRHANRETFSASGYKYQHTAALKIAYQFIRKKMKGEREVSPLENVVNASPYKEAIAGSKEVIAKMLKKYGPENVIFAHIPQKDEIESGGPNLLGELTKEALVNAGAQYYDGFRNCKLNRRDFFVHDSHPNAVGYEKVSNCVLDATKKIFSDQSELVRNAN